MLIFMRPRVVYDESTRAMLDQVAIDLPDA